jgi:hypothetical protein
MNTERGVEPATAWVQVIAILTRAADTPRTSGAVEVDLYYLALGAQIVASRALVLLPTGADGDLEDLAVDDVAPDVGAPGAVRDLIRAAGQAACRCRPELFPAGATAVIAALADLVAEAEACS